MELPGIVRLGLIGAIALLDIISLGLLAFFINQTTGTFYGPFSVGSPSSANFMLFNTIWTILVLIYLVVIPRFASSLYHIVISLPLLAITTIFWFAGSIALAAKLGAHTCSGSDFCSAYQSAQAATAFGFFIWFMFLILAVFELLAFLKDGKRANADTTGGQMTTQTYPGA